MDDDKEVVLQMSDRFVLVDIGNDLEVLGYEPNPKLGIAEHLIVDTACVPPKIVATDWMSVKDANFTRDLAWVPDKLNELARELECERFEVQSLKAVIEFDKINNNKQHEEIMELRAKLRSERDNSSALNEFVNVGASVIANQRQRLEEQEKLIQSLYLELGSKNYQNE